MARPRFSRSRSRRVSARAGRGLQQLRAHGLGQLQVVVAVPVLQRGPLVVAAHEGLEHVLAHRLQQVVARRAADVPHVDQRAVGQAGQAPHEAVVAGRRPGDGARGLHVAAAGADGQRSQHLALVIGEVVDAPADDGVQRLLPRHLPPRAHRIFQRPLERPTRSWVRSRCRADANQAGLDPAVESLLVPTRPASTLRLGPVRP